MSYLSDQMQYSFSTPIFAPNDSLQVDWCQQDHEKKCNYYNHKSYTWQRKGIKYGRLPETISRLSSKLQKKGGLFFSLWICLKCSYICFCDLVVIRCSFNHALFRRRCITHSCSTLNPCTLTVRYTSPRRFLLDLGNLVNTAQVQEILSALAHGSRY